MRTAKKVPTLRTLERHTTKPKNSGSSQPLSTLRTRKLLKLQSRRDHKSPKSSKPRYAAGTRKREPLKFKLKHNLSLHKMGSRSYLFRVLLDLAKPEMLAVGVNARPLFH